MRATTNQHHGPLVFAVRPRLIWPKADWAPYALFGVWLTVFPRIVAADPSLVNPSAVAAAPILQPLPPPDEDVSAALVSLLTLPEAEALALANNPSLARARALVAAARGNWVQAGLPFNPEVGYLGQQLGSGGEAEQHGLLLQKEFITGGKLGLSRNVAAGQIDKARQALEVQSRRVITDVRIAFYEALLADRRVKLADQLMEVAQSGLSIAGRLQKAGETTRVDTAQARLELENANVLSLTARNRQAAAWRSLIAVMGTPQLQASELQGDLEAVPTELSWQDSLARLLTASPETAAAAAEVERARAAVIRARAEPIPNLTVQGVVMQDNAIGGKTDGIVQVTVPLPIVNKNQGAIRQAEAELAAAQRAYEQLELDLQNRLAPVFEQYANAVKEITIYRNSILPTARDSLDAAQRGFNAGEFPYVTLLNAQRAFFQSNLAYLEVLRTLQTSAAQIDGLLLSNSLQTNP